MTVHTVYRQIPVEEVTSVPTATVDSDIPSTITTKYTTTSVEDNEPAAPLATKEEDDDLATAMQGIYYSIIHKTSEP